VYEKSRDLTGRAAGHVYVDHGAQYFRLATSELRDLVAGRLSVESLIAMRGEVWTFDAKNVIRASDRPHDEGIHMTYREGIDRLGALIAAERGLNIKTEFPIGKLIHDGRFSFYNARGVQIDSAEGVEMSGAYSHDHFDDSKEAIIKPVVELASQLFHENLTMPDWTDLQNGATIAKQIIAQQ
jgi:predicted NAD/FAD-dependent oxidoreductase